MALSAYHQADATKDAAKTAANATQSATDASIAEQEKALQQQKELSQPYRDFGQQSLGQLSSLLGLSGADPTAALRATPGYQFTQQQGTQNTLNAATASGMALSGNTLEALSKFNTGLADTTYQQAIGNAQFGAGLGQAAAAGQAANIGGAAANIGNSLINQGNNIANIGLNEASSLANIENQYRQNTTQQGLSIASMFL